MKKLKNGRKCPALLIFQGSKGDGQEAAWKDPSSFWGENKLARNGPDQSTVFNLGNFAIGIQTSFSIHIDQ